jgi:beta-lactamase regulating signal transducer with metallopeptidase domain
MVFLLAAAAAAAVAVLLASLVRLWLRRLADPEESDG